MRLHIALMRMAGYSAVKISTETGYHVKTIQAELKRDEHKNILHKYLKSISRRVGLPEKSWAVIEKHLKEQHT